MSSEPNWWPKLLLHIPVEAPWGDELVTVAEIRSFDDRPYAGHRHTFSALVPVADLQELQKNLAGLSHEVSTSGPHPSYTKGNEYLPKFWIDAHGASRKTYEALVLSWHSHDKTVLMPDPGFLMTYGLTPRSVNEKLLSWDDPAAPKFEIVLVESPSVWKFPMASTANVRIAKDYLQDFLTLRNMALVQGIWELRSGNSDEQLEELLGTEEVVEKKYIDRTFQINRNFEDKGKVTVQVWAGRVVALPDGLPVTENSLETEGLLWPGFPKPITDDLASRMRTTDKVYVSDAVLGAFEGRQGFRIHPKSGSVDFGTQWGVGFCDRVGRDLIEIEIKKLYEGVPPHATRHWQKFAVEPPPKSSYPQILHERNIATRSKEIVFALVDLGEALASLSSSVELLDRLPEHFIGLRRHALEYHGWWTFDEIALISRHVPISLSMDAFLDRCLNLHKLVVENLSEKLLRETIIAFGIPAEQVTNLGTLKLLNLIVCMAQVATATGLSLRNEGIEVWNRLAREGTNPAQPIAHLFALYDIRLLEAHKAPDRAMKLQEELKRFGVAPGAEAAGYGRILDGVYDQISVELSSAASTIAAATKN